MTDETFSALLQTVIDPNEYWYETHVAMIHKATNVKIWIANGLLSCRIKEPCEICLSLLQKFKMWRAIDICRENIVLNALKKRHNGT